MSLVSKKRQSHCQKNTAASPEKASIAALTHDYAKERPDDEFILVIERDGYDPALLNYGNAIWHGLVGASFVERELVSQMKRFFMPYGCIRLGLLR